MTTRLTGIQASKRLSKEGCLDSLVIDGDLDLSKCKFAGDIRLMNITISGALLLQEVSAENVICENIRVGTGLLCGGLTVQNHLVIRGVEVGESIVIIEALLRGSTQIENVHIKKELDIHRTAIHSDLLIRGTSTSRLLIHEGSVLGGEITLARTAIAEELDIDIQGKGRLRSTMQSTVCNEAVPQLAEPKFLPFKLHHPGEKPFILWCCGSQMGFRKIAEHVVYDPEHGGIIVPDLRNYPDQ